VRIYLSIIGLFFAITSIPGEEAGGEEIRPERMNVLMIALDDLNNYPAMMKNYPGVQTPNFEAFAKTALQFTRAYCPGTMCNPSRSAILSGIAPYRSGIYENSQKWQESSLLTSIAPLPQAFRQSGYHTMGCGKLFHSAPAPDQWKAMWNDDRGGKGRFAPNRPGSIPNAIKRPGLFNYGTAPEEKISDFQLLEFARERLNAEYDKPFFMVHGIRYPHNPWVVPPRFLDLYPEETLTFPPPGYKSDDLADLPSTAVEYAHNPVSRSQLDKAGHWKPVVRHYLASISAADAVFGEVISALDSSPHRDNTIVVVWADHGFHMGEKEHFAKYALWEQTTNVMFMVRVPGLTAPGSQCDRTVSLQDLYPTLVELCRLETPAHRLDGRSVVPLFKQPQREWPYPAVTTHLEDDFAVRNETHRYIRYHDGSEELYETAADPYEWANLAAQPQQKSVKKQLSAFLPSESATRPGIPAE